ncbi:hypothetical protein C8J56DRAFT_1025175 [Mycena floridula]|nr:hypothetical protein C8J56DRAFT_1025175 [Mycena floridula]
MSVLTRRAALAQKSILNVLANELTTEIISLCDLKTQAILCCVSKLFRQLSEPMMYRIVVLEGRLVDSELVFPHAAFASALSAKPHRGAWVKDLDCATMHPLSDDTHLQAATLHTILSRTTELRRLCLTIWKTEWEYLEGCSFPELCSLRISMCGFERDANRPQPSSTIASFLNRHPALSCLSIFMADPIPFLISLPNLLIFEGTHSTCNTTLLENSPKLRSVNLQINNENLNVLKDLSRFRLCNEVFIQGDDGLEPDGENHLQEILDILKRHLPYLRSLTILLLFCGDGPAFASTIVEHLGDFKHLESFGCLTLNSLCSTEQQRDSILDSWIKSCPTLQECVLQIPGQIGRTNMFKVVNGKPQLTTEEMYTSSFRL